MTERPPWYGGNKIPESYLKKFRPKTEHDELPHELRIFLSQMGEMRRTDDNPR